MSAARSALAIVLVSAITGCPAGRVRDGSTGAGDDTMGDGAGGDSQTGGDTTGGGDAAGGDTSSGDGGDVGASGDGGDVGASGDTPPPGDAGPCGGANESNPTVPLSELVGTYQGFDGGLYGKCDVDPPAAHRAAGIAAAIAVEPRRKSNGNPAANGKIVLLSIGMSNTTQEFCSQSGTTPCDAWTFMGQAAADGEVDTNSLVIVNGALGGQAAGAWDDPTDANYDRIQGDLASANLSEVQVQIVWVKVANEQPTVSLPDSSADAYLLEADLGEIARALRTRYPNLQLVFVSSRIYAGYASTTLNPEPYAYESGFSVKWVIEAQIAQMENGGTVVDTTAGDLNYTSGVAPWIGWGPYLWANGTTARADGLTWVTGDFESDGTHPSQSGETKVADALLDFFKVSPLTVCWFLAAAPACQ